MRRLLTGIMVAFMAAAIPAAALASNQDVANQIKQVMESSGRMYHYRVGVKFLNGTVWLAATWPATNRWKRPSGWPSRSRLLTGWSTSWR